MRLKTKKMYSQNQLFRCIRLFKVLFRRRMVFYK